MKKILLNNLSLKLLSVVIAFITWLVVMYNINPMDSKTLMVPVSIINEDSLTNRNWVYDIVDAEAGQVKVEVTVKAKSFDLNKITENDFYLYVDMRYLDGSSNTEKRGSISHQVMRNRDIIEDYTLETSWLEFHIEEIVTREYKVEIIMEGNIAEDYTATEMPTSVPESVTITGRSSEVDRISQVVYYLNVRDASEQIDETGKPKLLDSGGNELTDLETVTMTPEEVQICLPIYQTKNITIQVDGVTGEPATGYGLGDITLDMTNVRVAGYQAVLANVFNLVIPAEMLNIEGSAENKVFQIDLQTLELPEGISLIGSNTIVNVTVEVEKLRRSNFRLQLPDDISIQGRQDGYEYLFTEGSVYITVEGLNEELSGMSVENIVAEMNVEGYEAGIYTIPLNIMLPEGISLVNDVAVDVEIKLQEEETTATPLPTTPPPTPQPTPTPIPTPTPQPSSSEPTSTETTEDPTEDIPAIATTESDENESEGEEPEEKEGSMGN